MRRIALLILFLCLLSFSAESFAIGSRVKDLTMIAGARENQLVGYGIVTGLAGDGDKNPIYTIQSVANMLNVSVSMFPPPRSRPRTSPPS